MVHGDDFIATGPLASLREVEAILSAKYPVKSSIMGESSVCCKARRILGRKVR